MTEGGRRYHCPYFSNEYPNRLLTCMNPGDIKAPRLTTFCNASVTVPTANVANKYKTHSYYGAKETNFAKLKLSNLFEIEKGMK